MTNKQLILISDIIERLGALTDTPEEVIVDELLGMVWSEEDAGKINAMIDGSWEE